MATATLAASTTSSRSPASAIPSQPPTSGTGPPPPAPTLSQGRRRGCQARGIRGEEQIDATRDGQIEQTRWPGLLLWQLRRLELRPTPMAGVVNKLKYLRKKSKAGYQPEEIFKKQLDVKHANTYTHDDASWKLKTLLPNDRNCKRKPGKALLQKLK